MTQLLFANNASSTLAQSITGSTTALALATGTGALFPVPTTGQAFMATLADAATRTKFEVVQVTAVVGDTLTVIRGQEGTAPLSWAAGDLIANSATAGTLATLQAGNGATNAASTLTASFTQPASGSNVTALMANTAWLAPGGYVYVVGGGVYTVQSVPSGVSAVLTNTGAVGNSSPGATVPSASSVVASGPSGPQGPAGTNGTNGTNGAPGAAATVTAGTTTTLAAGSSATVTNVGTSSAAILNFGIPKGADGSGTGTVTSVSLVPANGFGGSVNTATTTPSIVITCAVTGMVKGNGTVASAATAGTDYMAPSTGTSAQLLANNGSGGTSNVTVGSGLTLSAGTLTASGGGAWTKISTLTASNSATLDWTGLSGYSRYAILLEGLVSGSNGQVLTLRFGTGASPTWITSSYATQQGWAAATALSANNATTSSIPVSGITGLTTNTPGAHGVVVITNALSTSNIGVTADSLGTSERGFYGGWINPGAAVTAIRLILTSGNIASGTATLYGIN